MNRKMTLLTLCAMLLAPCSHSEAQPQAKVPTIGWLQSGFGTGRGFEVFRQALHELGYIEGKNIAIQSRSADGKLDRLPAVADELVRLKVDVFLTSSTDEALAAKNATRTIPIVFYGVSDPIASGLVDSLARPGGNITGYTNITAVLAGKRLELLKETIPKLSHVAVLWDPKNKSFDQSWKESQFSARELGLQLHSMEVSSAEKFESAFKEAIKARSAAFHVVEFVFQYLSQTNRRPSDKKSSASDILSGRFCHRRWPDVLRTRAARTIQAGRRFCRQNPQRRQTRRPASRATNQVRVGDQS